MNKVKSTIIATILIGFLFAGMSFTEGASPKKKNNLVQITKNDAKKNSGTKLSSKVVHSKSRNSGKSLFQNKGAVQKNRNTSSSISKAKSMSKVQNKPSMQEKTLKAERNQSLSRKVTRNKQQKMSNPGSIHPLKDLENGLKEGLKEGLKYGLKEGEKK